MTDTSTHLTRIRASLLAAAYCNADFWNQRNAVLTDLALAALARRDPGAAEDLAGRLRAPNFVDDSQILGAAREAGIDTSGWDDRRERAQLYARDADTLPPHFDPATNAHRLWASLLGHYPQVAKALAEYLNALPDTWREDLFTPNETHPAHRAPKELPGPETAPYDPTCWEDCAACAEAQDQCRYHRGFQDGQAYQTELVQTLLADSIATELVQERHAALEHSEAQQTSEANPGGATLA